ncbi:MAG: hypothetical protein K9L85_00030 [Candidatus Peribacteraceae bacterium]|nr:hypothetical protein [Candidatus Peribacteraceae bacterium]
MDQTEQKLYLEIHCWGLEVSQMMDKIREAVGKLNDLEIQGEITKRSLEDIGPSENRTVFQVYITRKTSAAENLQLVDILQKTGRMIVLWVMCHPVKDSAI